MRLWRLKPFRSSFSRLLPAFSTTSAPVPWLMVVLATSIVLATAATLSSSSDMADGATLVAAAMTGQTGALTVHGRLAFVGNPCTTDPCLPGMAFAVQTEDGQIYFLVSEGRWVTDQPWRGARLEDGEQVTVTGHLSERTDIFGRTFSVLEIVSLQRNR